MHDILSDPEDTFEGVEAHFVDWILEERAGRLQDPEATAFMMAVWAPAIREYLDRKHEEVTMVSRQTERVCDTTGRLDRVISEMILLCKDPLDEVDWQTMKHHAEDMSAAAKHVLNHFNHRKDTVKGKTGE